MINDNKLYIYEVQNVGELKLIKYSGLIAKDWINA